MAKQRDRSNRQLKLGENIRHALSKLFMKGAFLHPESNREINVLISEVRISPDARNATAFFLPVGEDVDKLEKTLNKITKEIQYQMAKEIHMKYMPKIHFKKDETIENAHRINELLNED